MNPSDSRGSTQPRPEGPDGASGPSAAPRRFRLADGLIFIAASAAAISLLMSTIDVLVRRFAALRGAMASLPQQVSSGAPVEAIVLIRRVAIAPLVPDLLPIVLCLAIPLASAQVACRLLAPRPDWRRLPCQPGFVAAVMSLEVGALFLHLALTPYRNQAYLAPGAAIIFGWAALLTARCWRAEDHWIDRLGRVVGVAWIAWTLYCAARIGW